MDRKRFYEAPDFAFIAQSSSIDTIQKELKSLVDLGSCYYEIYKRYETNLGVITEDKDTRLVVLFFDDPIIDVKAEVLQLRSEPR
jgi:hypothetical protein